MPTFVSKNGIWDAAKERAFIPATGEIYEGPDRAAMEVLKENGGEMGQDARMDPQLLQASRNAGFNSIDEYLAHYAPKPKDVEAIKKAQEEVVTHKLPTPKPMTSANGSKGGFSDEGFPTAEEIARKK